MSRLDGFWNLMEDRRNSFIFMAFLLAIFALIVAWMIYSGLVVQAFGYLPCAEMNLGDNWTQGYVTSLQEQCFKQ